ncbi:DUF4062 domain-containing protein [Serratia marcescens]|uniref:DUF4062 domain-containing protein n=2 Tax=Serratia marcescens TaxID=615 RepID=UPI00094959FE|nr:DUF4062 domain-containing protein [Serratia marcescens]
MKKYQVFISSTFTDLHEERQEAVSAILKNGHIPAGMELFTAGDKNQWEIIKRWIDESDIYILILGGRYGSIEKESGLSYTELEYNYALETGKPLFSIVINENYLDEKVHSKGKAVLEQENPQLLKSFRGKVTSNLVSFFSDLKDIRLAIMESLPEIARGRELSGWVSGNSIPDVRGLVSEIGKLNEENGLLRRENERLSSKIKRSADGIDVEEFDNIRELLDSEKLLLKKDEYELKEDLNISVLRLVNIYKTNLINGLTISRYGAGINNLLSNKVFPIMMMHGLAEIEKIPGGPNRRHILNKKGLAFLAYLKASALQAEAEAEAKAKVKDKE